MFLNLMDRKLIKAFLEAFAVGDAYGKTTEYCSRETIEQKLGKIRTILRPEESLSHKDLPYGTVTDDTEQNVYLIKEYARKCRIDALDTAECLLHWWKETDAERYMGPSSLSALISISKGKSPNEAGMNGTTCGGVMRVPSAFLFSTEATLERNVVQCLLPTHNTSVAIEAAMAYAYALMEAAKDGSTVDGILKTAIEGGKRGRVYGNRERIAGVSPSVPARIDFIRRNIFPDSSAEYVKRFLYDVIGATMSSSDVVSCVFGIFCLVRDDVALAIELATEMGGDTDTIGCLAAGLCTLYAKGHNIPKEEVKLVSDANNLDFDELASAVTECHLNEEDMK